MSVKYYDENASKFKESTQDANMEEMIQKFLTYLPKNAKILDAGSGIGRDTKRFIELGYYVEAFDASIEMVKISSEYTGIQTRHLAFEEMDYIDEFDGIWACASLLHVSRNMLQSVFIKLNSALKSNGIIYASFKHSERDFKDDERSFTCFTESSLIEFINELKIFKILSVNISGDVRQSRGQEYWVNIIISRKYNDFSIVLGDSSMIIDKFKDNSIKLIYGSPPYPNAKRNYKTWKIDNYIEEIAPLLNKAKSKLTEDGFIVLNIKANRVRPNSSEVSSERSLIVEELMIYLKKVLQLYCVDIEIWIKSNPVPTGVRVSCQDAYEYNLWFSKSKKWEIQIDSIRREYTSKTLLKYKNNIFKPRKNGLKYIGKEKKIIPNVKGALPVNVQTEDIEYNLFRLLPSEVKTKILSLYSNVLYGAVSGKSQNHQAVQPEYVPEKYILACTKENDLVVDPWSGSGTTGITAIKNRRRYIGIDIEESYVVLSIENVSKLFEGRFVKEEN